MILPVYLILLGNHLASYTKVIPILFNYGLKIMLSATVASLAVYIFASSLNSNVFTTGNLVNMKMHDSNRFSYYKWIDTNAERFQNNNLLFACPAGLFSIQNERYIVDSIYPMPGLSSDILDSILEKAKNNSVIFDCRNETFFRELQKSTEVIILDSYPINDDTYAFFYRQKADRG
jgi:hypothetical protein